MKFAFIALLTFFIHSYGFSALSKEVKIPMQATSWEYASDKVAFITHESVPAMKILPEADKVVAKDLIFETGTIEYDVMVNDYPFVGFSFHRKDDAEEEWFYLRTHAAGKPQLMDAIQYTPIIKGVAMWDMYPQYQGPANFHKNEWTHVKLVVGVHQMLIYINESDQPTLEIPFLEGNYEAGSIAFNGEAMVANVVVIHDETDGLSDKPGYDPIANDTRYIQKWEVSEPEYLPKGREVMEADIPGKESTWAPLQTERGALVNLSRKFGAEEDGKRRLVWLKTTLNSSRKQTRKLSLGFSDEVWVMLNGQLLYLDKNYYNRPITKEPNGRCSIDNTMIEVPLLEGENEILIAVGNFFYGWGIIARWDKLDGTVGSNELGGIQCTGL